MLSTQNILRELAHIEKNTTDVVDFFDEANSYLNSEILTEAQYDKVVEHLQLEVLDVDRFVHVNNCKPVSDPRAFIREAIPSPEGLLSQEIFGVTQADRAGTFAYIDLHGYFIDPSCYKAWCRIDSNVKNIVHGLDTYRINDRGELVQDPKGQTGIEFLRKNIDKIKFKSTESLKRDIKIQYLNFNRDKMFINKYIVIPPYYRDKNTGSRTVGLGGINKIYNNLIVATNALTATRDYMFDSSEAMKGRVQEIILSIYDWFCGNNNPTLSEDAGSGLSGKFGYIRRTNMSKTADFSSRLVISAPELKAETPQDMMVTFEHCALPLPAAIAEFRDFVTFHVKSFFENEFNGLTQYAVIDKNGKVKNFEVDDPEINLFSDERIKHEMERFIHGYNNRFIPIEVPLKDTKEKYYMTFKGRFQNPGTAKNNPESIYQRRMTWCDIFYIAAVEALKDKKVLIARFPIKFISRLSRETAKK